MLGVYRQVVLAHRWRWYSCENGGWCCRGVGHSCGFGRPVFACAKSGIRNQQRAEREEREGGDTAHWPNDESAPTVPQASHDATASQSASLGGPLWGGGLAKRVSASNDATRKCALFFSSWIIRLNHSFVEFSSQERTRTKKEGKKGRKLHHGLDSTDGVSGTTDGRGVCAIDGRGGHTVVGGREAVGGQGGQVAVGARGHVGVALFMAALVAN